MFVFAEIVHVSNINMTKPADIDPLLMEGNSSQLQHTLKPEKAYSYLGKLWAETRNQVRHDLKSTRWRHTAASFFTWLGFSIWALGLIILCIIFPLVIAHEISLESSEYWNYCAPDGSFSLEPTNPWSPDWTFQIVLAFGSLSFTQAKVVDIVWDVVSSDNFQSVYTLRPNTKLMVGNRPFGAEPVGILLMEGILCIRESVYGDHSNHISHILDKFHAESCFSTVHLSFDSRLYLKEGLEVKIGNGFHDHHDDLRPGLSDSRQCNDWLHRQQ